MSRKAANVPFRRVDCANPDPHSDADTSMPSDTARRKPSWKMLLIILLALAVLCAGAWYVLGLMYNQPERFSYTINEDGASVTITAYDAVLDAAPSEHSALGPFRLTIPQELGGLQVTAIGRSAFQNVDYVHTIELPQSVQSIGDFAFQGCSALRRADLPDGLTDLGRSAFSDCSRLSAVEIPQGVTVIESFAFGHCLNLGSVTMHENVTRINGYAFADCEALESLVLPASVVTIEPGAFTATHRLTLQPAEGSSFRVDSGLLLDSSNTVIACTGNQSAIVVPEGTTALGTNAFFNCQALTSVTLPDSLTTVGNGAFSSCDSLTSVVLPDSVTAIESSAFMGCDNLASVTVPDSVTSIGDIAFSLCPKLTLTVAEGSYAHTWAVENEQRFQLQ